MQWSTISVPHVTLPGGTEKREYKSTEHSLWTQAGVNIGSCYQQ